MIRWSERRERSGHRRLDKDRDGLCDALAIHCLHAALRAQENSVAPVRWRLDPDQPPDGARRNCVQGLRRNDPFQTDDRIGTFSAVGIAPSKPCLALSILTIVARGILLPAQCCASDKLSTARRSQTSGVESPILWRDIRSWEVDTRQSWSVALPVLGSTPRDVPETKADQTARWLRLCLHN